MTGKEHSKRILSAVCRLLVIVCCVMTCLPVGAQQYTGMSGLIHVPSAEMEPAGSVRVGMQALPKNMMPDGMVLEGEKYASTSWYLSATPLRWFEIGYDFTLMKFRKNMKKGAEVGYYSKDRYFSLRIQPLYEGRYWPAIVVGGNDVWGQRDGDSKSFYFRNFYLAATKHFQFSFGTLGAHLAYRYWTKDYNSKWKGVVGGITFRPSFYDRLRFVAEYDGAGVNVGVDCTLLRHVQLQAALVRGTSFTAGVAFTTVLAPRKKQK